MKTGDVIALADEYRTEDDIAATLTQDGTLLGSAAPPDVELRTADGGTIQYSDVNKIEP